MGAVSGKRRRVSARCAPPPSSPAQHAQNKSRNRPFMVFTVFPFISEDVALSSCTARSRQRLKQSATSRLLSSSILNHSLGVVLSSPSKSDHGLPPSCAQPICPALKVFRAWCCRESDLFENDITIKHNYISTDSANEVLFVLQGRASR